ncbi:MAG TPA: DUF3631 domain-containing protein [Planctomycetota bacterium]|nr:DUF3631 domain-containing protein [Planctomycetota bacterium]
MRTVSLEYLQDREPLTSTRLFLDRVVYAKDHQKNILALTFAASHALNSFNTMPRVLVRSREPMSGKTTVLDAAMMLCQNGWMADPTIFALRSKFAEPEQPTLILDELSKFFGENGLRGRGNPLYKPLVEGYRKSATFSMSVDRTAVDVSGYCLAVLAGLGTAAPRDLITRAIPIDMRPMPLGMQLEDTLDDGVQADGIRLREQLHDWAQKAASLDILSRFARESSRQHPKLTGRKLQVWGPPAAMARAAGGPWPRYFMEAFTALALDVSEKPVLSAEEQILYDTGEYLADPATLPGKYLLSAQLLKHLRTLDEKLYTAKSDAQLARLMTAGLGRASTLTLADRHTAKGWHRIAIQSAYADLLTELEPEEAPAAPDEFEDFFDIDDPTTETTETTVRSVA